MNEMPDTIEELIYTCMTTAHGIREKLAKYEGKPAVFYQNAPSDEASGWKNKAQYPRIDITVDMQANPERQTSGQATVNIWCNNTGITPEEIEPDVRNALCGVFMTPEDKPPYCLSWQRSDAFDHADSERAYQVAGITMIFDIFAFPNQVTSDPDPIMAINRYAKALESKSTVIGHDTLTSYYEPQAAAPAFYFRIVSMETAEETNSVAWMNGTIAGHVFAPTAEMRLRWIKCLINAIALDREITMLDTSPMFIQRLAADSSLDMLSQGQIRIQVRFGILRKRFQGKPLSHIGLAYEKQS